MTSVFSDPILISVHRSVSAAKSDCFSALLYGSLKEDKEKEIKLLCSNDVLESISVGNVLILWLQ